jgi:putative ABC transport system permease protein
MKTAKSFKLAFNILLHSRLRSWLTIIGIVIGVAAVVSIISIGEGLQQNVESRLGDLGADIITISPGGGRATSGFAVRGGAEGGFQSFGGGTTTSTAKNLTKKDILIVQNVPGVSYVEGTVSGRGVTYYLGQKSTLSIKGVDQSVYPFITTSTLESGRMFSPSDYNVVIIGYSIAHNTFKEPLVINRDITIEGKAFKIIGILQEGSSGEDNTIIMPIQAARDTLSDIGNQKFDSIVVKVSDANLATEIADEIDSRLMISRHVVANRKDYRISTAAATQARISDVTSTITLFLGAIAAVSLLVGAVGIANTMFTSVLEKTKEIGIMKAIGAKNADIMVIFILNSGMVGLVGGLIGILFGTGISLLLPQLGVRILFPGGGGFTTAVTPNLLIYSVLLSVAIGVIAGAIPAYRASKLKPVDALRYE